MTKKEIDRVQHEMTWPPQSPDLNPIEMVWAELDGRVKEKQSAYVGTASRLFGKAFLVKLVERTPRVCKVCKPKYLIFFC